MKLLKVNRVTFKTGVLVAHNVRSHLDLEKHQEFLQSIYLAPGAGVFVLEKSGAKHYFPDQTITGCILEELPEDAEAEEPAKKRGRPFKVLPEGPEVA